MTAEEKQGLLTGLDMAQASTDENGVKWIDLDTLAGLMDIGVLIHTAEND